MFVQHEFIVIQLQIKYLSLRRIPFRFLPHPILSYLFCRFAVRSGLSGSCGFPVSGRLILRILLRYFQDRFRLNGLTSLRLFPVARSLFWRRWSLILLPDARYHYPHYPGLPVSIFWNIRCFCFGRFLPE